MSDDTLSPAVLKTRAIRGTLLLILRKFMLRSIGYVTFLFVISRMLTPADLGLFAIVNFIITFLGFFSDSGLGAALIQRQKIDERALKTTFVLQQGFVFVLVISIFFAAPLLVSRFALGEIGLWLLRALSVSLIFSSLKTIPMIRLERALRFERIIIPEVIEVLSYQGVLVTMLLFGFGVSSFVWAILVRGVLGVIAMYIASPWKPGFAFDPTEAKALFRFGLPYQSNYFIALVKDSVTPVFVGLVVGQAGVGFLNWAFTVSKFPIEFISEVFRVTFPAYARIRDDKTLLQNAVERSLKWTNMILFPAVAILTATIGHVDVVLFSKKWTDAIPAVYIHSFGVLFFGIISTCTNALWALGRVRDGMIFMLFSTIINWGVAIPLVFTIGYNGAMIASTAVLVTSLPLAIFLLRRTVSFSVWSNTWPALVAAGVAGVVVWALSSNADNIIMLASIAVGGLLVYISTLFVLEGEAFLQEIRWFIGAIRPVIGERRVEREGSIPT